MEGIGRYRANRLQDYTNKSLMYQPSIKISQYMPTSERELDRSTDCKDENQINHSEFQFQNNKRFEKFAKNILNQSLDMEIEAFNKSMTDSKKGTIKSSRNSLIVDPTNFNINKSIQTNKYNMSVVNDDEKYLTTKYIELQSKAVYSDLRKSIALSSELDDLFNDIMEEDTSKTSIRKLPSESLELDSKPILGTQVLSRDAESWCSAKLSEHKEKSRCGSSVMLFKDDILRYLCQIKEKYLKLKSSDNEHWNKNFQTNVNPMHISKIKDK